MLTRRQVLQAAPLACASKLLAKRSRTTIDIHGDRFLINGVPTYRGRSFEGMKIEGLLFNTRMVQGIFDDENPETVHRWKYPDTGKWNPERNNREFLAAMPLWRNHGVLSFTINFQGGSPEGYSKQQPWHNSSFRADGTLKPPYLKRMKRILDRADELGMAPIVGYFYFGQDQRLTDDAAVRRAVDEATRWILGQGYRHVLIEVANECDNRAYDRDILKAARIHELIEQVKSTKVDGRRLLVGASFNGGSLPTPNVVRASDFILLHGNGVSDPNRIFQMVQEVRRMEAYRPMPILFNEDDHFEFDKPVNNLRKAVEAYASWGYFDPGKNNYQDGFQSLPVRWDLNTERKKQFFTLVKKMTGF
ncbi:MAG: hypothetical protein NZV14_16715 [Bryobacteraceae bacterium]|nr:hypothetical protein [Bryobacteraceae bacterium]MDW8379804.1 hypothetical protein [Bryobacterales bacterium]